jgi:hypothetical protein
MRELMKRERPRQIEVPPGVRVGFSLKNVAGTKGKNACPGGVQALFKTRLCG